MTWLNLKFHILDYRYNFHSILYFYFTLYIYFLVYLLFLNYVSLNREKLISRFYVNDFDKTRSKIAARRFSLFDP